MKVGQDVCLDEISDEFENGSCGVKNKVTRSNLRKPCVRSRGHILSRILMEVGQDVCLDDISDEFENGSRGVKN